MEEEALRADPRVPGVVLTVVEDLTVETLVGVVPGVASVTLELALGQEDGQTVGLFLLLLQLLQLLLLQYGISCSALCAISQENNCTG